MALPVRLFRRLLQTAADAHGASPVAVRPHRHRAQSAGTGKPGFNQQAQVSQGSVRRHRYLKAYSLCTGNLWLSQKAQVTQE